MDVLFLAQRVPFPPDRGDRITTYHFLRHYAARGAKLRIGGFAEEARDVEAASRLRQDLLQHGAAAVEIASPRLDRRLRKLLCLRAVLGSGPMTLPFFHHRGLAATVRGWFAARTPDLVHVYSSSMAQYVPERVPPSCRRLMQFAELDSDKWAQYARAASNPLMAWLYRREARTLLAFEASVARRFDWSAVCSPVEKELFEARIPTAAPPVVLPNGVDVEHFARRSPDREAHTVVFTGVMDYEPNVDGVLWFVAECWPAVREEFPDARLLVVGSRPVPAVRALDGADGIEVTGRVPEIPPYLERAAVAVAPLRLARGVQNKVLEAMSMGVAVVSSPQAAQGIEADATGTRPLEVADGAYETTRAVLDLLRDPDRARSLGDAAGRFVRARYRWESMFERLDRLLEQGPRGNG